METRIKHRLNAFERAARLATAHPVNLSRAGTLAAEIDDIIRSVRDHAGDQDHGHAAFRSGSAVRAQRAAELLELMRTLNRIVRALDPEEFPGLKEKFRMPRGDGYERLLGRAAAFVDAAEPIKTVFIERGLEPDFIEQILARCDEMHAALATKNTGLAQRVGSTAGLAALTRRGTQLLRELDAILTHQYRHDPSLLAAWKSACHLERDPQRNDEPETLEPTSAEARVGGPVIDSLDSHEPLATGVSRSANALGESEITQLTALDVIQPGNLRIANEPFTTAMAFSILTIKKSIPE
jgi:hypothetical protein